MNKFFYEAPRVSLYRVTATKCLMASGENLGSRSYGSKTEEELDDFWN